MTRIAHISDIHFGRIAYPGIVDALVADINAADVDLVVVSGDLTQRAFGHQFRAARRMLEAFDAPTLVVPGNHDVYPWWRPFSRLLDPLRRYRRIIEPDLAPSWQNGDVAVRGINSAFGWTVQGGRITEQELERIRTGYDGAAGEALRVLVVHHHLAELAALAGHDRARGAERAFQAAQQAGVGLILCGHLHKSLSLLIRKGGTSVVIASCGTTTSSRSREQGDLKNAFFEIIVGRGTLEIVSRTYDPARSAFLRSAVSSYELPI